MIQLLAPIVPYVTDAIYQALFASAGERVHLGPWPEPAKRWVDDQAERIGEELLAVATAVRRYKTARSLRLGSELAGLGLASDDLELQEVLREARADLTGVTRARELIVGEELPVGCEILETDGSVAVAVQE